MTVGTVSGTLSLPLRDPTSHNVPASLEQSKAAIGAGVVNGASKGAATRRNETIDAIRAFAAAGIVLVHASESPFFDKWSKLFRFAVPFFLFASLYFQALSLQRNANRPFGKFVLGRVERLYMPFIAWSLIYLLSRDLEHIFLLHLPLVRPRLSMLWTGTEYHLWFLPFLLGWSLVLAVLYRGLIQRERRLRWIVIAAAVIVGCAVATLPKPQLPAATEMTYTDPQAAYAQWLISTPAALGALAFACFVALGPTVYAIPISMGWAGMALLAVCSVKQALSGIALAPRALTGLGSMLVALAPWKTSAIPALARIGRRGYGIYLCHVFPVRICQTISHRLHLHPSIGLDLATLALSFFGAWVIVVLLEKSPKLAWLNG